MTVIANLIFEFIKENILIKSNDVKILFNRDKCMWENPYYFFRIPSTRSDRSRVYKEIKIDITQSAWSTDISADYKKVLSILLGTSSEYTIREILDFGCGKFNSVKFILSKRKRITVVDYKELLDRYEYLNELLADLQSNTRFTKMEFPNPFINDDSKFDLALIANVLPVMPVFLERLFVLQILYNKIKNNKFLLWYAMKNPKLYRDRERSNRFILGDGIWLGKAQKEYKTFYKYHPPDYLAFIMYLSGFHLERVFKVPAVDSILFKKSKYNLFKDIITKDFITEIGKYQMVKRESEYVVKSRVRREIEPISDKYDLYSLVKTALSRILPGQTSEGHPNIFKRLAGGIIYYLVFNQIEEIQIEEKINEGRGQIDITLRPSGVEGFFKKLRKDYDTKCPVVFIEAKNKGTKLTNTEYTQLYDRFGENRGKFGFLVCRNKFDEAEVKRHLKDRLEKGYMIVLDDKDLLSLLKSKIENGEDSINKYFLRYISNLHM